MEQPRGVSMLVGSMGIGGEVGRKVPMGILEEGGGGYMVVGCDGVEDLSGGGNPGGGS